MKSIKQWKKSITLTTFFWAVTAALSVSAYAATSATRQASQSGALEALLLSDQRHLELTQSSSCAEVVPPNGLYVRREPTVYSEAIGILEYRTNITAEAGGTEEWLPISTPLKGYVWRGWVAPCSAALEMSPALPEVEAVSEAN